MSFRRFLGYLTVGRNYIEALLGGRLAIPEKGHRSRHDDRVVRRQRKKIRPSHGNVRTQAIMCQTVPATARVPPLGLEPRTY
ncbi:MAG TPA: hypothetical protein DCE55_01000 [Planctomycetaceae bacterium]|nr:hypothetical protein [Planctomycetaceae bacterium]